jgi:hypothetical protein
LDELLLIKHGGINEKRTIRKRHDLSGRLYGRA